MSARIDDRIAITDLVHAYARLIDLNRPEEVVAELFTEDCTANYGAGDRLELAGRDALLAFLSSALDRMTASSHHCSNISIEFDEADADRATGEVYLHAWHRFPGGPDEVPDFDLFARYLDTYRRGADGRWRFARRRLVVAGDRGGRGPYEMIPRASRTSA